MDLTKWQLNLWFQIEPALRARSILKSGYDFRPNRTPLSSIIIVNRVVVFLVTHSTAGMILTFLCMIWIIFFDECLNICSG